MKFIASHLSLTLFLSLLVFIESCGTANVSKQNIPDTPATPASAINGELVFQSGFEGSCKVIPYGAVNNKITGTDNTLPGLNDWDEIEERISNSHITINYTGGDSTRRYARIIPEPGNPSNKVFQFWLNDSWLASENQQKARVQVDWYGIKEGYREFYQSVRVFLTNDFNALKKFPKRISWLTLSEFWNNEWWVKGEPHGFRITLGIGKPASNESELNFILNAEDAGQKEVWRGDNTNVKVPVGKWFTMEYYIKQGGKEEGRFYMAITPDGGSRQVVFDITNYTHNTKDPAPNGFTGYNPMKLYTSKEIVSFMKADNKTLEVYWDDFKLWKNKRP